MSPVRGRPPRFRAFLSYSHKDRRVAAWLHRALESYRVPHSLVGRTTPKGKVPADLGRFFRDEEELTGSPDLGAVIREALTESEHLLVLCSSFAAKSPWIAMEIQEFRRLGRGDRILPVLVTDRPGESAEASFPRALLERAGRRDEPGAAFHAPLAVNLRRLGRRRALANVVASLTGLRFDDLWRRERRRRWRRIALWSSAALLALAGSFGLVLYTRQRHSIDQLMAISSAAVRAKSWDLAAMAAAAALPVSGNSLADPKEAVDRLAWLRGAGRTEALLLGHRKSVSQVLWAGEEIVTASLDTTVRAWPRSQPHRWREIVNAIGQLKRVEISPDGERLLVSSDFQLAVFDLRDNHRVLDWVSPQAGAMIKSIAFAENGLVVLVATSDGRLIELGGAAYGVQRVLARSGGSLDAMAVSPSGSRVAFGDSEGNAFVRDLAFGKTLQAGHPLPSAINQVTFGGSDMVLFSGSSEATIAYVLDGSLRYREWFTLRDLAVLESELGLAGSVAVSVLSSGSVAVWRTNRGDLIAELTVVGCKPDEPFNPACQATHARFVSPGIGKSAMIAVGYRDGAVRIWSIDGRLKGELFGHVGPITQLSLSPDGTRLLSASEDHTARLWQLGSAATLDPQSLRNLFCRETDPSLRRFDPSLDLQGSLNYASEHDPTPVGALKKELASLDACKGADPERANPGTVESPVER